METQDTEGGTRGQRPPVTVLGGPGCHGDHKRELESASLSPASSRAGLRALPTDVWLAACGTLRTGSPGAGAVSGVQVRVSGSFANVPMLRTARNPNGLLESLLHLLEDLSLQVLMGMCRGRFDTEPSAGCAEAPYRILVTLHSQTGLGDI